VVRLKVTVMGNTIAGGFPTAKPRALREHTCQRSYLARRGAVFASLRRDRRQARKTEKGASWSSARRTDSYSEHASTNRRKPEEEVTVKVRRVLKGSS